MLFKIKFHHGLKIQLLTAASLLTKMMIAGNNRGCVCVGEPIVRKSHSSRFDTCNRSLK